MYCNKLSLGLSRELWLVQIGTFLNMLGYGAVLPFEVVYLHDGRGFGLGLAGLVVGTLTGAAVLTAPLAGPLIDRWGARATACGAAVALAVGYGGLAFAVTPGAAFAAAALAGAGNGALVPSQSTLIAALAPPDRRHRATAVSRVAGNAGMGIGGALGGLVAAAGLRGFVALFLANAVSYLVYVVVLLAAVADDPRPEPVASGYRLVLRDRAFRRLAGINVAMIAVGWGVLPWVIPPYAEQELGLSPRLIGLMLLVNAATVVAAQVPIARLAEGRRRVRLMALAGVTFAGALALVAAGAGSGGLLVAAAAIAIGECLHTTALTPLVADLAPPALRGRYMAALGLSWWIGLALAPTLGTPLLTLSPAAALLIPAAIGGATAASALALEPRLPDAARRTPRPVAATAPLAPR